SYVLKFKIDNDSPKCKPSNSVVFTTDGYAWESEIFGSLKLSHNVALITGLQRTSINILNTPPTHERPFCYVFQGKKGTNADETLEDIPIHTVGGRLSVR